MIDHRFQNFERTTCVRHDRISCSDVFLFGVMTHVDKLTSNF